MLLVEELIEHIRAVAQENLEIYPHSALVGANFLVDSMSLVQICLALEERSQSEGFSFDWTSEKAMSSLNSVFKTPETLTAEYNRQLLESNQ